MYQYELAYPNFSFIGPTPIDFDKENVNEKGKCVWEELCNFSLSDMLVMVKTKLELYLIQIRIQKEGNIGFLYL